ncbi:MAG: primosomal protein N' [Candidatus Eremiobacteraeota bacterium]|nr:primosomal protein N' [Candidatus Eremiobacteraeota bacterium]MCW5871415.1 primosomal protein N' [Candidatus Eremiobacteraeota bacterium]
MPYAQVVVDFPQRWADQLFTYEVPAEIGPGRAVLVPFGQRQLRGFIASVTTEAPADVAVKPILEVLGEERVWSGEMIELAGWMCELYACTLVDAFQAVVPPTVVRRLIKPPKPRKLRKNAQGLGEAVVQHQLNEAQREALEKMDRPGTLLLEGVTGSGKTEVYLAAVERALKRGQSAIVLVPEVSLTPQAIDRYQGRLGEQVAVLHSRLSDAERTAQWLALRRGQARLALGTRSAIFAPLEKLGLIVLDEEHDSSYKQDSAPRYHARQVAAWRARHHQCPLVLGSATPCLESYVAARSGRYGHVAMGQRAARQALPQVELIDLRRHRLRGREDLSGPLLAAMQTTLEAGQQVVLLYNRRGFARYLQCPDCGKVVHCPHCSISLTVHRHPAELQCHYCGHRQPILDSCRECGSVALRECGSGTEKLLEEVQQKLPGARVLRMDRDTTGGATGHADILRTFAHRGADVLLGTQMVSKGLDFPAVTLVGVVGADQGLHVPDFRAAERVLQLLTQVAGRAGRGQWPGRVIMQARDADHAVFEYVRRHDYAGFLEQESEMRRALLYPPFARLARLIVSGEEESAVESSARLGAAWVLENYPRILLLGPSACPLEKIQGNYRWHFLLKGKQVKELAEILRNALRQCKRSSKVRWAADIDPQSIL